MNISQQEKFAQVKAIYERDIKLRPLATDIDDIPVTYELITPQWLTKTLCRNVPGAEVLSHSLDVPDEGTSNRRRIFLRYNEIGQSAGLPASVFCKASQSLQCRYVLGMLGVAEMEVSFYNHIRPLLDIESPLGYFAAFDPDSLNSIIVLQDLKGAVEFCNGRTVVSFAQAASQMDLLAKLHGSLFRMPGLANQIHSGTFEKYMEKMEVTLNWSKACENGFNTAEAVIPKKLFMRGKEIWPATVNATCAHANLPKTLIHNDTHLGNWYITTAGTMGLEDWQGYALGHWSRDLAYTIATSVSVENRREWEKDLIRHYLKKLAAEGGYSLSFEHSFLLYRQQMFTALSQWTGTLTPGEGAPDMQPSETSLEFIKRITHAIDDLDALASFSA